MTQQETKGTDTTVPCPAALPTQQRKDKPEFPVIRKTEKTDFRLTKLKIKMAKHTKARVSNVILEITLIKDIQKKFKIST